MEHQATRGNMDATPPLSWQAMVRPAQADSSSPPLQRSTRAAASFIAPEALAPARHLWRGRSEEEGARGEAPRRGHKDNNQHNQAAATTGGAYGQQGHASMTGGAGAHGTDGTGGGHGEKKGLMDKIKEKLPGHH